MTPTTTSNTFYECVDSISAFCRGHYVEYGYKSAESMVQSLIYFYKRSCDKIEFKRKRTPIWSFVRLDKPSTGID